MSSDTKEMAVITGWAILAIMIIVFGFGFALGGLVFTDDESVLPPSIEETCGAAADDICPGERRGDYSSSMAEACRSREFERCLAAAREPTMEQCRDECADIVKDLRQANDDLWERWLACSEAEMFEVGP